MTVTHHLEQAWIAACDDHQAPSYVIHVIGRHIGEHRQRELIADRYGLCIGCLAELDHTVFHDDDPGGRPLCADCCPTCDKEHAG